VVPPGEGWSLPPFGGVVREGKLYGRGAIDAKSLGVAHLEALVAARQLAVRRRALLLVAVGAEERGGAEGARFLLERHPELFAGVEAVLNEGGANRTVLGRTLLWGIETTQKRPLWLEVTARGKGGHAAAVNVESAAHRLIAALARMVAAPPRWRVSPAARAHFAAAGRFDPHARALAADLDAAIGPDGPRRALLPGMAGYFLDTVQVTRLEAGAEVNVTADRARATIDVRLLPDTDGEAFLAELRERLGPGIEVEVLLAAPPAPPAPSDTPFFAELAQALGEGAPTVPVFIAGVTDSRWFRERGIPAYGLSPFALEVADTSTVHAADERIPLAAFERGVERMRRLVRALVEGNGA
jgi:acetylornithine deacetylase/succinyl-diaminopimelate desuccinylase-like protein